jgi:hypothetical protein
MWRVVRERVVVKSPVRYVVNWVMWCRAGKTFDSLGFSHSRHHIIFFK